VATFCWLPRSRNKLLHPEEVLATKDRLAQPSSWVASFFLPCDSPGVGERGFGPVVTQLLQLTGTINTSMRSVRSILARGANPSILNRHRRELQPWRCRLATYYTPTFPTSCLHFPPTDPPGLQFNTVLSAKLRCCVLKNLWLTRGLSTTRPSTVSYFYT
jgi:hypothetical protein